MNRGNPWLPMGVHPEAELRLLCLPHAGAGAGTFSNWGAGLPAQITACPVQPPGRERRRREPPFTSVEPLVKELAPIIASSIREPFALFGHSTGALCAFETVRELRRIGGPAPVHLFVAGRRAPQSPMERHDLAAMDAAELAGMLKELGGTPQEVLGDPDMLAFLQPLLAADFCVNEEYTYVPEEPLDIPLTAFAGVTDQGADVAHMSPWEVHTTREFRLHALDGGHFAVIDRAAEVHSVMATSLAGRRQ